jgi:RNA polymerase sigma-70 factor, ECF subfamily
VLAITGFAMNEQDRQDLFSQMISRHHSQLYAYIFAVVKNQEDAEDLFQSVCLVLWRKFESFQPNSSFFSWARQTAKLVLCSFLRHKKHLALYASEEILDALAETVSKAQGEGVELHLAALRRCKEKLGVADDELLRLRYVEDLSTVEIADRLQRLQPNVSRSLNRIRRWLLECVRIELARGEHPGRNSHE